MALGGKAIFGFGPAPDKDTPPATWYRHRAIRVGLGEVDQVDLFTPEVGGYPVPDGAWSAGPLIGGGFELQPRLKGTFGWLLAALTGSTTSTALDDGTNPDGSYQHEFAFGGVQALPWLGFRVYQPGDTTANDVGREFIGNRVLSAQFTITTDAPPRVTMAVRGRKWQHSDPSTWAWANAFEDTKTVPLPVVSGGSMTIPGFSATALPVVAAQIGFVSAPADMRFDRVLGSPYLDDVTIVNQVVTVDATLKWKDATLYRAILNGSSTGTAYAGQTFEQDFDLVVYAPETIPSTAGVTDRKYELRFSVPRMLWQVNGPPTIAGNDVVLLRLRGTALLPGPSQPYAKITLINDQASYTW